MGDFGHQSDYRPLLAEGSLEDLEGGRVAMSLNEPRLADDSPCEVEGAVTVRGWAHARGGIEAVHVIVDGRRYEALRPIVRTDLLEYYGLDAAKEAGFVLRLHPSECPPGRHRIAVVATGRNDDAVGVEGEVVCRPDPLESDAPPDPVAPVDWIEERTTPRENAGSVEAAGDAEAWLSAPTPVSPDEVRRLHGLALMWESRALLAEADAAASRIEAGLASTQQEVAIGMLRAAEERLHEMEATLSARGASGAGAARRDASDR